MNTTIKPLAEVAFWLALGLVLAIGGILLFPWLLIEARDGNMLTLGAN